MAQNRYEELLSFLNNPELLKITEVGMNSWRILRIKFQALENQKQWERLRSLAIDTIWPSEGEESDIDMAHAEYANHDLLVFKALVRSSRERNDTYVLFYSS